MSDKSAQPGSRREFLGHASVAVAAAAIGSMMKPSTASAEAPSDSKSASGASQPLKAQRLKGKVAIVTGAARGIGRAIAVEFAREGADVMGIDIAGPVSSILEVKPATPEDLKLTEDLVKKSGQRFISVTADVRNPKALAAAAARALKEFGHIDIVVGNAGIQVFKPLLEMTDQHWGDIIDNNLTGYFNTIRAFAPALVAQGKGRIILIGSSQGRRGSKHAASYSASKWGVIGLTKSAAIELGEHKITVNCVIPGLVDTPLTRNPTRWREALGETMKNPPAHPSEKEVVEASKKNYPLQVPWLQPEDIAPAVTFLATDEAAMISGAEYDVTAGFSAHYDA